MTRAAKSFLDTLSPAQQAQSTISFDDAARLDWHFIPKPTRKGIQVKEMNAQQRNAVHALLHSGLSEVGYEKATVIMTLESILHELEKGRARRLVRDANKYYFTVFGTPAAEGRWGWSVEGHHLSVNFSIDDGKVAASTPSFFGANPAEVKEGPLKGLRPLGREEDLGRELLAALDSDQRQSVMIAPEAPDDILMRPEQSEPEPPKGVAAADMTPDQREMLFNIVGAG